MIYLNYTDLNEEAQERLLENSKKDVERQFGNSINSYAKNHHLDYEDLLDEEAIRNLYNYTYVFNI